MANQMEQNIKRGIQWLNNHYPGWESRIHLSQLDMSHCNYCLLGQLDGDYCSAQRKHNLDTYKGIRLGFVDPVFYESEYPDLTTMWRKAIELMRSKIND